MTPRSPWLPIGVIALCMISCVRDWDRLAPRDAGPAVDAATVDAGPADAAPSDAGAQCAGGTSPRPTCDVGTVALCTSDYTQEECCPDLDGEGAPDGWLCHGGEYLGGVTRAEHPIELGIDASEWSTSAEHTLTRYVLGEGMETDTVPSFRAQWDDEALYLLVDQRVDTAVDPSHLVSSRWWLGDAFEIFIRPVFARPVQALDPGPHASHVFVTRSRTRGAAVQSGPWVVSSAALTADSRGWPVEMRLAWLDTVGPPPARAIISLDVAYDDADTREDPGDPTSAPVRRSQVLWSATSRFAFADARVWGLVALLGPGEALACPRGMRACAGQLGICVADRPETRCP